jgi:hypothetical protein
MAYINPAPGSANQITLTIDVMASIDDAIAFGGTAISVPALQDITINASNDVFSWEQLDSSAKKQVATTSTNSVDMNVVVDPTIFFGTSVTAAISGTAAAQGLNGMSRNKTPICFSLKVQEGAADYFYRGKGYITGLAPTISASAPVWVSPVTITVDGEFTVATV